MSTLEGRGHKQQFCDDSFALINALVSTFGAESVIEHLSCRHVYSLFVLSPPAVSVVQPRLLQWEGPHICHVMHWNFVAS